ncbi:MAG: FtsX-like permease family protein [Planctomycetota bacterium]
MYQALLTRRYLTRKIMPLLAAAAVMLCVAMELIVWSVMGGFLEELIDSGRSLIGDIEISRSQVGIAHYEDLLLRLEADELIVAASPTVEAFGLISLDIAGGSRVTECLIKGIDPESFDRVTGYRQTLYWKPLDEPLPTDTFAADPRLDETRADLWEALQFFGESLERPERADVPPVPLAVLGIEVFSKRDLRDPGGFVQDDFLTQRAITVNVLPTDTTGGILEPIARRFVIANEFSSGVYEIDSSTMYVPLGQLQDMLKMDEAERVERGGTPTLVVDPETGEERFELPQTIGIEPARATTVLVRGRDDADLETLRRRVRMIYEDFSLEHPEAPRPEFVSILTWEDRNATLIGAIRKETALVMFIFGVISLTSVFLVLAIFWSMVSERTKDVGVLRALGASRSGVAWLWIRYGLAIGAVGTTLGIGLALLVISNINAIHDWLGRALGLQIWDPAVYYFTRIPEDLDAAKVVIVAAAGVLSCMLGAVIPAVRAARMDPVRALRFE